MHQAYLLPVTLTYKLMHTIAACYTCVILYLHGTHVYAITHNRYNSDICDWICEKRIEVRRGNQGRN